MTIDTHLLACPTCKSELTHLEDLFCPVCKITYPLKDNKYYFLHADDHVPDKLDQLKKFLKQFAGFYNFLIAVLSPVYIPLHFRRFIRKELTDSNMTAINLGSGNSRISKKIVNIDIYDYSNVDVICDINNLPVKDRCIDLIISIAVLEHVPDPKKVVDEIKRVLKPGGKIYIYIPFIQGYHASPYDYQRYTYSGIQALFREFEIIETRCGSGPSSGFLWIFQEWLAIILSFGIKPLYRLLHLMIMAITFPIKFLDLLFIYHPYARTIASAFTIIAEKKNP